MDTNQLIKALDEIKRIKKRVPASNWTPELREIVNATQTSTRSGAPRVERL
jgi:hypothetical protein